MYNIADFVHAQHACHVCLNYISTVQFYQP